ncbi:hypothetical protein [Streptomyces sp. NPDC059466]|uniref:hypothetical protein n=1 Tax=unclassified Streptomyces TaxID=2593676 RepID=UPI0036C2D76A
MSENSATRALEDGQNRAFEDGRTLASGRRPPLTATASARDGDVTAVPGTGYGPVADPATAFHRMTADGPARRADPHDEYRQLHFETSGLGRTGRTMADQPPPLNREMTRVTREAGAEGRPGGRVKGQGASSSC